MTNQAQQILARSTVGQLRRGEEVEMIDDTLIIRLNDVEIGRKPYQAECFRLPQPRGFLARLFG